MTRQVVLVIAIMVASILAPLHTLLPLGTNLVDNSAFAQNNIKNLDIVQGAATLGDQAFSPDPLEVSTGTTAIWTNLDSEVHTVVSGDAASGVVLFSSPELSNGMQFNYTFDQTGNFSYYCSIHPSMVGKVVVTDAVTPSPDVRLTIQTDKPSYHVSETAIVSGTAPAGRPITIKIVNPTGAIFNIDNITASSQGSFSYILAINGPFTTNGTYHAIVTSESAVGMQYKAEALFSIENYPGQEPKIGITSINTHNPRFDIDDLELSGTVSVLCHESTIAPACPPQMGIILWGDGTNSTFDANISRSWGPIKHIFATAGPVRVLVGIIEKDNQSGILAQDGLDITVMKHKTSLSNLVLSNYTIVEGKTFEALRITLVDIDSQTFPGGTNNTITFSGPAIAQNVTGTLMNDGDFAFPVDLVAVNQIGNMTLRASFAGNNLYEPAAYSAKVPILILATPASNITKPSPLAPTTIIPTAPSPDCRPENLQCSNSANLLIIILVVAAGGGIGAYKIIKKSTTKPDKSKKDKNVQKESPRPNVFVRSGEIRGYIELDGERFEQGGR